VGRAHIGFFGSVEETALEKTDVLRFLEPGGTGVINADDCLLGGALADVGASLVTFSVVRDSQFQATGVKRIGGSGSVFSVCGQPFRLRVPGIHNVYNAIAAVAAADLLGIGLEDSAAALESFRAVRARTFLAGSVRVMDDSYNANPDSVRAALDTLNATEACRRIVILGEMLELGSQSEKLHREVGSMIADSSVDVVIGIGGETRHTVEEARVSGMSSGSAVFFETKADAMECIKDTIREGDAVLVKGSRLTGLEEICEFIRSAAEEEA
jgi:UDP-N-acetylmuramoyl-tripeptide--D-alanyl-D-alanine ligase